MTLYEAFPMTTATRAPLLSDVLYEVGGIKRHNTIALKTMIYY